MPRNAEVRWWNRALPVKPIGGFLAIVVMAGAIYFYFKQILRACFWDVGHHSTATYQGLNVKVPWMWRQEETPAGQRQLRLVRARIGEPVEFESIIISNGESTDLGPQAVAERLKTLAAKLGHKEFQGTPISLDPETARHFSCIAPHFDYIRDWQASCLSTDSLWSADLFGPDPDLDSLRIVLRGAVTK